MNSLYDETLGIIKKFNIRANKGYGQNFLTDEMSVNYIIDAADIDEGELVIEIGPGLGTLTELLLKRAKKVVVIEIDDKMVKVISNRFANEINSGKLEVINEDVLKLDLNKIIYESGFKRAKIVANLPYYITTPIVMKLLEDKVSLDSIIIMIQKEVAERLIETPGGENTGAITYAIYYYTQGEKVVDVSREYFIPSPDVDSTVIKLTLLNQPRVTVEDEKLLFELIKKAFLMRRKTLVNALNGFCGMNKEDVNKILEKMELDVRIRGERLSLEQYAEMLKYIK